MIDSIFKRYDIRGKVDSELLLEEVYPLAQAFAYYFVDKNPHTQTISIGCDGRTHSPMIKEELCRGLRESGLNVIDIGIAPTPVLYFSLFSMAVDAGIMITASHNTKEYNGFKICLGRESVWGEEIQKIKLLYQHKAAILTTTRGTYTEIHVTKHYNTWIKHNFPHLVGMQLPVLIDCGNGAAGSVLPELIHTMKWNNVALLFPEVDGTYPNHEADPLVEKNMRFLKDALLTSTYSLGIGLDGDCDRMAPMTKNGQLIMGDIVLALFAHQVMPNHPGSTVIFDTKCSSALPEVLKSLGAHGIMSASGHSIIKDQIKQHSALLAGELSGHFFFKDRYFGYDDGIYAMLRLFELLLHENKTLDELIIRVPKKYTTAEMRITCALEDMDPIIQQVQQAFMTRDDVALMTIDGIRVTMKDGWGMVRASNTQPVICFRFESNSKHGLEKIKNDFVTILHPFITHDSLYEDTTD